MRVMQLNSAEEGWQADMLRPDEVRVRSRQRLCNGPHGLILLPHVLPHTADMVVALQLSAEGFRSAHITHKLSRAASTSLLYLQQGSEIA